jgi:hypothetical protein
VDRRPVVGLDRVDDDVAVQAELLAVVLPDVRVVPVQTPSYLFSNRNPCQCTVVSMSPSLVTCTTISEPCCTRTVGPGMDPL